MADQNSSGREDESQKLARLRNLLNRLVAYDKASSAAADNTVTGQEFVVGMTKQYFPTRPELKEQWAEKLDRDPKDLVLGFGEAAQMLREGLGKALAEAASDDAERKHRPEAPPMPEALADEKQREATVKKIIAKLPKGMRDNPQIMEALQAIRTGKMTSEQQAIMNQLYDRVQQASGADPRNLMANEASPISLGDQIAEVQKQLAKYKPENIKDPTLDDICSGLQLQNSQSCMRGR